MATESSTISLPRTVLTELGTLSPDMLDRMHELLSRNTDGDLNPSELGELKSLVRLAEIQQIIQAQRLYFRANRDACRYSASHSFRSVAT